MAILNTLRETDRHPTAEWVYAQLRPKYPNLSLGTVYRNLKLFCETGKAVSVGVINGQEHFDGQTAPHAHFVCEKCGAVLDVAEEAFRPEELLRQLPDMGWKAHSASLVFRGVCKECRRLEKEEVS